MKNSYQRICWLIAAADFDERDIREFATSVRSFGPTRLADDVSHIRKLLVTMSSDDSETYTLQPIDEQITSGAEHKIARLLIDEARLTKSRAVDMFKKQLSDRYPNASIPESSHKGFLAWLRKLTMVAPESELLHIATQIRNQYVHERPPDWRLRSNK